MTKINLLPHRELKRKARRRDFGIIAAIVAVIGAVIVAAVGFVIQQYIDGQNDKNKFIVEQSKKLDEEIKEIAKLKEEIEALKARQKAVEDLQADRNLPVHVLDELVKQTPEGVYLRSVKQEGMRISVNGLALNNARVADYIRNIGNNSPWVASPDLVDIVSKSITQGSGNSAVTRRLSDFTLGMTIQRQKAADAPTSGAAAQAKPVVSTAVTTAVASPTPAVPAPPAPASPAAAVPVVATPAPAAGTSAPAPAPSAAPAPATPVVASPASAAAPAPKKP